MKGRVCLDFQKEQTTRILNTSLLHRDFGLSVQMPIGKLVPTLPLRLNYILWLEDIVRVLSVEGDVAATPTSPFSRPVTGIDIGCGATCIYPLLATRKNSTWTMYALESDPESANSATENVQNNQMSNRVQVILQRLPMQPMQALSQSCSDKIDESSTKNITPPLMPIFDTLLRTLQIHNITDAVDNKADQHIADFCMCNPPFFADAYEKPANRTGHRPTPHRRLSGFADSASDSFAAAHELAVKGGESAFIGRLIFESLILRHRIRVYSSMIGHKVNVSLVWDMLEASGITNRSRTVFGQGRTLRWAVAWSFDDNIVLSKVPEIGPHVKQKSVVNTKPKSFSFELPMPVNANSAKAPDMLVLVQRLETLLFGLRLRPQFVRHSADLWNCRVVTGESLWLNARRRRRQAQRASEAAKQASEQQHRDENSMDVAEGNKDGDCSNGSGWRRGIDYDAGDEQQDNDASTVHKVDVICGFENAASTDEPYGKRMCLIGDIITNDEAKARTENEEKEPLLCVDCSIVRHIKTGSTKYMLDIRYVSGDAGENGTYQLSQFIRTHWKQ